MIQITAKTKSAKKKITLFHQEFYYSGGAELTLLETIEFLQSHGFEVEAYAPLVSRQTCFPDIIEKFPIKSFLPYWSWLPRELTIILAAALAPVLVLKFRQSDIFYGANQAGPYFAWLASLIHKKPFIVYMPYPQGLLYPRKIDTDFKEKADFSLFGKLLINALKPILKKIDSKIIASANVVITEGEYSQRLFENIYHRAVINCPAGADPISEQEIVTTDRFKGELKLNNLTIEKPYILLTNRHVPKKKLEYAIELAKLLKPTKFKDTPVIITGKYTDYTKVLLKTISDESISNIFFTNYTSDETTRLLYKNASLYIYTAPEEDYGKGIIQAMANGIPVIAWNNAGPSKIIKDSYSGHLIQPFNLPEMASKTIELLENHQKNQELGKNGYSETINKFSRNIHNRIILESIEPLI